MRNKLFRTILCSFLLVAVFSLVSSILFAVIPGDKDCTDLSGCGSNFGCEASSWRSAPDCWLECKVEGKLYCDPL